MVEVTRMSSKGQVVIPERLRKELDLKSGTVFRVETGWVDAGGSTENLAIFLSPLVTPPSTKQGES